jgi:Holliday junction resolvase RusA-like endonuclease
MTSQYKIIINPMGSVRTTQAGKFADKRYHRYRDYKTELRLLLKQVGIHKCPSAFFIKFVMPFPVSYTDKKKDTLRGKPHTQKPDLDNLVKGFMDCFGTDDSGVHAITMLKVWGDEGKIILGIEE